MNRKPKTLSEKIVAVVFGIVLAVIVAAVLAPAVLTVVLSFGNDPAVMFPPRTWGLANYETLLTEPKWLEALWLSVRLALVSALLALLIGLCTLIAAHRSRLPLRGVLEQSSLVSLILPVSAYAVAMLIVYSSLGLRGSVFGLVMMYAVLGVPMVVLITGASLRQVDSDIELVANTLGASKMRALGGITLPMILPGVLASFAAAFQLAFEEAVFIDFIGGPGLTTLPKAISDSVRYGSDPVITAIAAALVVITTVFIAVPLGFLRGKKNSHD